MDRLTRETTYLTDWDPQIELAQDTDAASALGDSIERSLSNLWIDVGGEA